MSKVELSTKEIELSRFFLKGARKPELLVLVEDEKDDVPFWQKMFECVSDKYLRIHVHSIRTAPKQYRTDGDMLTATGKNGLMQIDEATLGTNKMIAVDADYDLVIDDYHEYTNRIRNGKYVIHTSYYSVENHLLTEGTLGCLDIWNRVGGSVKYPWKNILEEFAKAIGDILRISISSTAFAIKERKEGRPCTSFLTIGKLHQEIDNLSFCLSTYSSDFAQWKIAMDSKYGNLKNTCTSEYSIIGELMKSDSPLVFLQGHSLYDFLLKIMKLCFAENKSIAIHNISTNTSLTKQEQIEQIQVWQKRVCKGKTPIELIHDSVYNCDALDMKDCGIVAIQQQILANCP